MGNLYDIAGLQQLSIWCMRVSTFVCLLQTMYVSYFILQRQLSTKLREYVEVSVSQDGSFTETSDGLTNVNTSPETKPVSVGISVLQDYQCWVPLIVLQLL